jgi:ectoine hydroxylase-related dioxygenase (phytanoyl-CoA dioxygenase family)
MMHADARGDAGSDAGMMAAMAGMAGVAGLAEVRVGADGSPEGTPAVVLPGEQPFVVANDVRDDSSALRALLDEHGYLFFRGLMDTGVIWQLRLDILGACRDAGWLDPVRPLEEGVWNGEVTCQENDPEYMEVYRRVLKLPSFQQFPFHPTFIDLAKTLVGGEVLMHPRRIGRITFPLKGDKVAVTPPHQDWSSVRGTPRTFTMWVPLGDCPRRLGNLAILDGSHRMQFQPHVPMKGIGNKGVVLDENAGVWHSADYMMGDFVVFHSYTIHQGLPNLSGRYLRLSTDNRYQLASEEVDPSSLRPHFNLNLDD